MQITPRKINTFMLFKLPLAYIGGVRVKKISETDCIVKIKHRWLNQNPFKSMFWAAQGMAAEMTTGVLVMKNIAASNRKVSMLVTNQKGTFTKKATGRIQFVCKDGNKVADAIQRSIDTGEGQTITMLAEGINEEQISVSSFEFEWSLKVKE
ncbi:DUF4442 domain-containing protein [Flavobacteriaceae bacterium S356]|uniref:DUF4442 domain-containing protein n=1 Tax=Asprobacillus argus TaxID=3076534 RepID=A0ABU3LGT2_9FLAO|nr:DUF4442 domain-containing protein [Flavobacteriaceae bacterium S356]